MNNPVDQPKVSELIERLARNFAVAFVDGRHGFTMEFAPSPAAHRDEYDEAESYARIVLETEFKMNPEFAALTPQATTVGVKALEWDNQGRAICLLGLYLVDIWHAGEGLWRWKGPGGKWKISNGHWTEEDAKAAAQVDYDTRIRSALIGIPGAGELQLEAVLVEVSKGVPRNFVDDDGAMYPGERPRTPAEIVDAIRALASAAPPALTSGAEMGADTAGRGELRPIFLPGEFGHKLLSIGERYMSEYEFDDGENAYYVPTDEERIMLTDAINGLFGDEEFSAILQTLYAAPTSERVQALEEAAKVADAVADSIPYGRDYATQGARQVAIAIRALKATP